MTATIKFHIPDMKCKGCAKKLTNAIQVKDNTIEFNIDVSTRELAVQEKNRATIEEIIKEAGFTPQLI